MFREKLNWSRRAFFAAILVMSFCFHGSQGACDPSCGTGVYTRAGTCQPSGKCLCFWGWTGPNAKYTTDNKILADYCRVPCHFTRDYANPDCANSKVVKDFKFTAKTYVFLLSMGTLKGKMGKVGVQIGSANAVYSFLERTSLIDIDKATGKLTLLKDLDGIAAAQFNNTQIKIQATTNDQSKTARTKVVIIILPLGYGDHFAQQAMLKAKAVVKTNHILMPGQHKKFTAAVFHRLLRKIFSGDQAKNISMAQMKLEKAIEMIKSKIILLFKKRFGKDTVVYGFLLIKKLISQKMMKEMESEVKCKPLVVPASCSATSVFRTFDGTCNNLHRPIWGASDTEFIRILPALYFDVDGLNDPIGYPNQPNAPNVPSPFEVSRDFIKDEVAAASSSSPILTHVVMQFGQFVDHDLDLVGDSEGGDDCRNIRCDGSSSDFESPCYPILPISNGQPPCIHVIRSAAICHKTGYPKTREQINVNTAYLDSSHIYGSRQKEADNLRGDEGLLRSLNGFDGELLPLDTTSETTPALLCQNLGGCFKAGDARSNEQRALASFHALFLREHNRIARRLKIINNQWDGERVYQETRKILGAVFQKITYYDYLPLLLGPRPLPKYMGYDKNVNPGISNSFATAAYRYGHSQIRPEFELLNQNFDPIAPAVNLRFMFFNNTFIQQKGIEPLLFGLIANSSENVDRTLSSGIIKHLFERVDSPGQNLAALNIQRSRDHGIPGYNDFRKFCGLSNAKTFEDTKNEIKDPENREILSRLYNNNPNLAELWVAGLAETPVPGGSLGPTFKCVIANQFQRVRDGDRFFYRGKDVFPVNQLHEIEKASLSRIYCDNLKNIVSIQKDAFKTPTDLEPRKECSGIPEMELCAWKEKGYFKTLCRFGLPKFVKKTGKCCKCETPWRGTRCDAKTAKNAVPWHVSILFEDKVKCSGALVGQTYVLTTRCCAKKLKLPISNKWKVRLGDYKTHRLDPGEKTLEIKSVIYPSDGSNIALIHLKSPVTPNKNIIEPIVIKAFNSEYSESSLSVWGGGRILQILHITLPHQKNVCKNLFTTFNINNEICSLKATFPYVLQRYPGSPLVQYHDDKPYLIGLLTKVEEVKSPREPRSARYIRVSQFLPWLGNYLGNSVA